MKNNLENYFNFNKENKINLPHGTPVYIVTTKQLVFFDEPSKIEGASRIQNVGVVPNDEIRKPTKEELQKWADERGMTDEELEPFKIATENWNKI